MGNQPPIEQMLVIPDKKNIGSNGSQTAEGKSRYLKLFGACGHCPVRSYCDKRELMAPDHQKRGCDEPKQIYLQNLKQWKRPATMLMRAAADIETRMMFQNLKDGKEEKIISNDFTRLMKLKLEISKMIMKYDPNATQQKITVKHEYGPDSDEVIVLDPEAYEDDHIPENPKKERVIGEGIEEEEENE